MTFKTVKATRFVIYVVIMLNILSKQDIILRILLSLIKS